jgi:hypothetical protein
MPQEQTAPMDPAAMLALTELRNRVGGVYGSETISLFFYTLIRRQRPRNVVELGTGLGVTAFSMAQAVKENGMGKVWTVDDGSHWNEPGKLAGTLASLTGIAPFDKLGLTSLNHAEYLSDAAHALGLADHLTFIDAHLELGPDTPFSPDRWPFMAEPIDLVFLDVVRTPDHILDTLFHVMPASAPTLDFFIDSASTSTVGYLFLETLVERLNRGKVPWRMLQRAQPQRRRQLIDLVAMRRFTLVHLVERVNRAQNSTAWLRMEPADHMPHPPTAMKWV